MRDLLICFEMTDSGEDHFFILQEYNGPESVSNENAQR